MSARDQLTRTALIADCVNAHRQLERARERYYAAFRRAFPVGTYVTSAKHAGENGACVKVEILRHDPRDRALVRNPKTDAIYWISADWIVEAGVSA